MNIIGLLQVDLDVTPLGTRSRLTHEIGGIPILRRTVERIARAKLVEQPVVICPASQHARCASLLSGTPALVVPMDLAPPSWRPLMQTARKWSLDGWRGGLGGATWFDEFVDARIVALLEKAESADAVLFLPPAAPVIDPGLIDAMIEHHRKTEGDSRLTFTSAPPGVGGIILNRDLVLDLGKNGVPVGWLFSYKPDQPQKDLLFQPCVCEIPPELRYATGRLTADTRRSADRVSALLRDHPDPDMPTVGRWLRRQERDTIEPLPREIEIELTTDDPFPEALLRPRGRRAATRGPIEARIVERIVKETACYDDTLLVLGGFGDPLRHPQCRELLHLIRETGEQPSGCGLAIRTAGVDLTDANIEAILSAGVDVVEVVLDAWTPALYASLQSPNDPSAADLEAALARVEALADLRRRNESMRPIIVASMVKARENVHELDAFHDGWMRKGGAVTIHGHCHYAGRLEDRGVIDMTPSPRTTCRRLRSRAMVLGDGRLTLCDQDVEGRHTIGSLTDESLESLWTSAGLNRVRQAHREGRFEQHALCAACDEWHRP